MRCVWEKESQPSIFQNMFHDCIKGLSWLQFIVVAYASAACKCIAYCTKCLQIRISWIPDKCTLSRESKNISNNACKQFVRGSTNRAIIGRHDSRVSTRVQQWGDYSIDTSLYVLHALHAPLISRFCKHEFVRFDPLKLYICSCVHIHLQGWLDRKNIRTSSIGPKIKCLL